MDSVDLLSINFGYLPTEVFGRRVMWVDLQSPAPSNMKINSDCYIIFPTGKYSMNLKIEDISGTRVVLGPLMRLPIQVEFGHTVTQTKRSTVDLNHNWKYAYGSPSSKLVYRINNL